MTSTTTSAAPERPVKGGVLRLAIQRPATLDPAMARPVPQSELVVADLLYDGLTAWDATKERVVPAVAESWSATDGARSWSFHLSPGVRFSDGSPVTAADVVATLDRVRFLGTASPGAPLLAPVTSVTAAAPDVVMVRLDRPFATFPQLMASPVFGIVPASGRAGVGSGPFRVRGGRVDLASSTVSLEPSPGRSTYVDGITLALFSDDAGAYVSFERGEADWSFVTTEQAPAAVKAHGDAGFVPLGAELFYGMNQALPMFRDARFREAVVRAVNREEVASAVYGGTMAARREVVPSNVPGGSGPDPCDRRCDYDPVRARALVADVYRGRPVPTIHIDFDADGRQQQVATLIAAALTRIGVPSVLRPHDPAAYGAFVASGRQELFRLGWTGGYPSGDAYLVPLFLTGSPDNVLGFSDPAVDRSLEAIRGSVDDAGRGAAVASAQHRIMTSVPVLPLGQFRTQSVVGRRVRGLVLSVMGTFDGARVWLAPR